MYDYEQHSDDLRDAAREDEHRWEQALAAAREEGRQEGLKQAARIVGGTAVGPLNEAAKRSFDRIMTLILTAAAKDVKSDG